MNLESGGEAWADDMNLEVISTWVFKTHRLDDSLRSECS